MQLSSERLRQVSSGTHTPITRYSYDARTHSRLLHFDPKVFRHDKGEMKRWLQREVRPWFSFGDARMLFV